MRGDTKISFRKSWRPWLTSGLLLAAACGYSPVGGLPLCIGQEAKAPAEPPSPEKVKELIQKLGAADFTVRQRAQNELSRFGLYVFDELQEAQQSEDLEIALRARQLVRSMNVQWATDTDSPEVAKVLKRYGEESESERSSRIDFLAKMPRRDGAAALCRLARYEPSHILSKQAALLVLQMPNPETEAERIAAAEQMEKICGSTVRPAGVWLRLYAKMLRDASKPLDDWKKIVQDEQLALQNQPNSTSREVVRDLHRYYAVLLKQDGKTAEALESMRASAALVEKDPADLAEQLDWLLLHEGHAIIDELFAKYEAEIGGYPRLLYLVAESQLKRGDQKLAKTYAEKAISLYPEDANPHAESAAALQQRGLFAWAEAEYRLASTIKPSSAPFYLVNIAEMLHDIQDDERAGDALQELLTRAKTDEATKNWLLEREEILSLDSRYARMHYFYYCDAMKKKDLVKAKQQLLEAIRHDPTEADVLIALYRLPEQTEIERRDTKFLIDFTAARFMEDVKESNEALLELNGNSVEGLSYEQKRYIALACNQYAWLIANTYGDFDEALRCGLLAVEIDPKEAGRIDTLGRCYYAKGDLDAAIRTQSLAAKLEPHSGAIGRQLKFFQEEKARQSAPAAAKP